MTEQAIQDAKVLHVSAPTLLPMIEKLQRESYEKLLGHFRDKGETHMGYVAECNAYSTILDEINGKLISLERHYNKEQS